MSHGIARLSQRLRRKIGSDSAAKSTKKLSRRPDTQQAGPAGACRDLTTSQRHSDDDKDAILQQHCHLGSDLHQSVSFSSSIPVSYLSSSEDITSRSRGAAASSIRVPNEEGPSGQQHQHTPNDSDDGETITDREDAEEPLPLSSTVSDNRATVSLGQSTRLATTHTNTDSPTTPSFSSAKPHSRHIASSESNTYTPANLLQTVDKRDGASAPAVGSDGDDTVEELLPGQNPSTSHSTAITTRKQSLVPQSQQYLVNRVLGSDLYHRDSDPFALSYHPPAPMAQRKIWVKRPDASATLVSMPEDSVVDELRDNVLRKYSNSLGRTYDSPDLMVRMCPRAAQGPDRMLSPEESLFALIDQHYPGGQTMAEALVVEAPQRRTPIKPSPRQSYYYHAEPGEHGEYFPLMPVPINVNTPPAHPSSSNTSNVSAHQNPSMSVLTTGKVPPLSSPGSRPNRHSRRPPFARHPTGSPTLISATKDQNLAVNGQAVPPQPSLPTPPAPAAPVLESPTHNALNAPVPVASPRPGRKTKKAASPRNAAIGGLIEGTVPPINVLIVEDNVINQKLLEAFMKRLSVRWQCAPNGEVAVKKWRQGGFHLVLMDIQLPVMNGLDATKEIRRLERLNGIGVFSKTVSDRSSAESAEPGAESPLKEEDILQDRSLFKSPVIVVALTASSLQSDRHEALAAGCNDFLTKPIGFPWLEQKVTEWGCMQALIDFEGWRKWRGYEDPPRNTNSTQPESSPTQKPGSHAAKVLGTKQASKVSVVEGESSGNSSGKDEDGENQKPVKSTIPT
ncbi:Response regulator mcs4 [Talaromyces islandicus]|uniref:Response regulator mcs4 n=1 Tax=Talaromyces islandicus TaxID=28573 RepID=A0A0U1LXU4_TALIS|nr:Response regulator mcs4 [Talaromyces islandicus]